MNNPIREALRQGKCSVGTWVSIGHPDVSDLLSRVGFDWLLYDMEHAPLGPETVHRMMQAQGGGALPFVRVPPNDRYAIQQALDGGAMGIMVPMINNAGDAEAAVRACRYPPAGNRNMGPRRATAYGLEWDDYLAAANDRVMVMLQIETREAMRNIDAILAVKGIDAALIGTGDLANDMGCMNDRGRADYQKAIDDVLAACRRAGVIPGIAYAGDADATNKYFARGFKMVGMGEDDIFLCKAAKAALGGIESRFIGKE